LASKTALFSLSHVGRQVSDLNIFHKFSPDFMDFSEVSGVTEELICRDAEETGELTREVPYGKDFPEYPSPVPTQRLFPVAPQVP